MKKERLLLLAMAFSSAFSGDFSAIEEVLETPDGKEDSDKPLKDFGLKEK